MNIIRLLISARFSSFSNYLEILNNQNIENHAKDLLSPQFSFKHNMSICLVLFLLITTVNLKAQSTTNNSSFLDKTEFKVGYFGNGLWDNGLNIGAEYLWKEKVKVKERKKGEKTIDYQLLFNGSIGYSTNFSTQTDNGLSTYYGLIYRRTSPKGFQFNLELSPIGYYRSFLPETYEVIEDEASKVRFPGRSYYQPSFAIGIGKSRKDKKLSGWYLNYRTSMRTDYNAVVLPILSLEFGCLFDFKNNK